SQSDNIDYRIDYQIDNKSSLSYQGGFGRSQQQADRNHDGLLPTARTIDNNRFFQFIKWENSIDQDNTLLIQYYYNLDDKEDKSTSEDIVFPGLDGFRLTTNDSIKAERHNLELTHFIIPNDDLKLVWGLSAQADLVHAPLYLGTNKAVRNHQFRGFANAEWRANQSNIINFGALAEKNDFTDTELSPRLSFTHAFNKQHSIRLGISQAIRSPFIFEAKANRFLTKETTLLDGTPGPILLEQQFLGGNSEGFNMQNERIISREIAYYGNFLNSSLLFNARLFHDDINDFIDTHQEDAATLVPEDNVPNDLDDPNSLNTVRVYQNRIESTTTGLELELDYRIDQTFRLITSGAIINLTSNDRSIAQSAPQHSFSFLASNQFNNKYSGSLAYYFVEAFKWTDSRGGTDDYRTLDIKLSRSFRYDKTSGSLSVILKNLLDDYSDYQETPSNSPGNGGSDTAPKVVHSTLAYIDFRLNF
ncbi:MAG: TonB-dependent receptor, partial [Gammaproteobacteria bacterium]|nr:TonB-dependent receptor [Gammaproteobacteria bacterium]